MLQHLPMAVVADPNDVLDYIERYSLHGNYIGYVDVHQQASTAIGGIKPWARDKRLLVLARALAVHMRTAGTH